MKKIRIGIISPSEIAYRRFLPALLELEEFEFAGVSVASINEWEGNLDIKDLKQILDNERERANLFTQNNNAKIFDSHESLLASNIDAVYIPLPPALHYKWAKKTLEKGKHIFLEKPFTTNLDDTKNLIKIAKDKNLALCENYMFVYHNQIQKIKQLLDSNAIGHLRKVEINFEFPKRKANDFRYNKALGGGALLDCGGYTLKLANLILGPTSKIVAAKLNYLKDYSVDMYGSATLKNAFGDIAQISFGMDNYYQCSIRILGSDGIIYTNRIFSAPFNYDVNILLYRDNTQKEINVGCDDTFKKSLLFFYNCIINENINKDSINNILQQATLVDDFLKKEISNEGN